jgi:hypothetical protein
VLRQIFVIFVPADPERLGPLFEGSSLPRGMPAKVKSLVQLMRLMFRARWDILEPRRSEAIYKEPSVERCAEIARVVLSDYAQLDRDVAALQFGGEDAFHELFEPEVWKDIDAYGKEWLTLIGQLKVRSPETCEELSRLLTQLRNNNAKWMNVAARQFTKSIGRYCEAESGTA